MAVDSLAVSTPLDDLFASLMEQMTAQSASPPSQRLTTEQILQIGSQPRFPGDQPFWGRPDRPQVLPQPTPTPTPTPTPRVPGTPVPGQMSVAPPSDPKDLAEWWQMMKDNLNRARGLPVSHAPTGPGGTTLPTITGATIDDLRKQMGAQGTGQMSVVPKPGRRPTGPATPGMAMTVPQGTGEDLLRQIGFSGQQPDITAGLPPPTSPDMTPKGVPMGVPMTLQQPPKRPSPWKQVLAQSLDALPDVLNSYTAARYNRPDIAENFLRQRALKIESAQKQAALEAEREQNVAMRAIKLYELEDGRLKSQGVIRDRMADLHSKLASGQLRDLPSYNAAVELLARDYQSFGGKAEDLIKAFPIPGADRLNTLRKEVEDYIVRHQSDPKALAAAAFENPYTGARITAEQAMAIAGLYDKQGYAIMPTPPTDSVTHNTPKGVKIDYIPKYLLPGMQFDAPPPPPPAEHIVDIIGKGAEGATTVQSVAPISGKVGKVVTVPGTGSSPASRVTAAQQMGEEITRRNAAKAIAQSLRAKGQETGAVSDAEINAILLDPAYQADLALLVRVAKAKVSGK